ncbi:60S ribosomal protein L23a-like [Onychomys torridus]|uniref:60S ribosomal protein L23a-like n=1 Tax=Onychomys torridus TaxID=38674 RepID=UPI00167F8A6A|nr:60S ribosomal protein L23a-like [Onychomys torridus]
MTRPESHSPSSPQDTAALEAGTPSKCAEKKPAQPLHRVLLTTGSITKRKEDETLGFIVEVKANKPQIKQDVQRCYSCDAAQVNALIRSDRHKKAYVCFAA